MKNPAQERRAIEIMTFHDEVGTTYEQFKADIAYDMTINGTTTEFLSVAARLWNDQKS